MSLLNTVQAPTDVSTETDTLGGGGPLDSNVYTFDITLAFLRKARSGALGLHLHMKTEDGRESRQTLYVTSGDAKGNKTYYENRNGEKNPLPGYTHGEALCLLTVGKSLSEMATENKVVPLYNPEAQKEVPTEVECLVELMGQKVKIGMVKQIVDKRAQGDDGQYHPTGETREQNEIDKVFRAKDDLTTAEIRAGETEGQFIHRWKAKWEGQTQDRTVKDINQGRSGSPRTSSGSAQSGGQAAAAGNKPAQSLFG